MSFPYTVTELGKKIEEYHINRELKEGKFPGLAGLLIKLDITDEEYDEAMSDPKLSKLFTYSKRRRMQWLEEKSLNDPRTATACKLLMAQRENGGYGDKAPEKKTKSITAILRGAGFDEEDKKDE